MVFLKRNCREDLKKFEDNQDLLKKLQKCILALLIFCCLLGSELLLVEWWAVWITEYNKIDFILGNTIFISKNCFGISTAIWKGINMFALIIVMGISYNTYFKEYNFVTFILNKDCTDEETTKLFNKIKNSSSSGLVNFLFATWLTFFVLEENILYLLTKNCKCKTFK
jgi:hypothetical protein